MANSVFYCRGGYILLSNYTDIPPLIIYYWRSTCVVAVLYICPLIGYFFNHQWKFRIKILELLGKWSWDIFCVQLLWYKCFAQYFIELFADLSDNCFLLCGMNIVVCVMGGCMWHFIETPITKYICNKVIFMYSKISKMDLVKLFFEKVI